jgi:Flp pilus assembly protein TadB
VIFSLLTLFFGTFIASRTLHKHVSQRFITSQAVQKTIFGITCAQFFILWWWNREILALIFVSIFPLICTQITFRAQIFLREKRFKDDFCHFLDQILLEMHIGKSFRASIEAVALQQDAFLRQKILTLLEALNFSVKRSLHDSFFQPILEEFKQIDSKPHNNIKRLQALRYRFRLQADFRRKSNQASLQAKAQSLVLIFLYIGTSIFVWRNFSLSQNLALFLSSTVLFLLGTIWIFLFSGRFRWKI